MKKILLAFILTLNGLVAFSQCTPSWPSGQGPGIMPDSATNLPPAYELSPYSATIQFKVPADTVFLSQTVPIDSIVIESVTGLDLIPSSVAFTYASNPADGVFFGDSIGCVVITGTPAAGSHGTYPIEVEVTGWITLLGSPYDIPYTVDDYQIVVNWPMAVELIDAQRNDLVAYPSLTSDITTLSYFTSASIEANINVYNSLGQKVKEESINTKAGSNTKSLDLSQFPSGNYFITLQTNDDVLTARVMLSK